MTKPTLLFVLGISLLTAALLLLWPSEQTVRAGDAVTFHYRLSLEAGQMYDASQAGQPLKATLGQGQLLPAFEEELLGMQIGESKTFTLPPEQAYGTSRPELIGTFARSRLPDGMEPEIGKKIQATMKDGTQMRAVITAFTDTTVTLDANHPLAGRSLTFEVQLLGIGNNLTPAAPGPIAWPRWLLGGLVVALAGFLLFKTRTVHPASLENKGRGAKPRHASGLYAK